MATRYVTQLTELLNKLGVAVPSNIRADQNLTIDLIEDCLASIESDNTVNTKDATAIATDILLAKTAYVKGLKVTGTLVAGGTDTSDADAIAADILLSKTAYVNGEKLIGTLEAGGGGGSYVLETTTVEGVLSEAAIMALATVTQGTTEDAIVEVMHGTEKFLFIPTDVISEGITLVGAEVGPDSSEVYGMTIDIIGEPGAMSGEVISIVTMDREEQISGWLTDNLKVHMFNAGTPGVDTSDADAIAADIALGKTAYADGVKLTGTLEGGGGDNYVAYHTTVGGTIDNATFTALAALGSDIIIEVTHNSIKNLFIAHTLQSEESGPILVLLGGGIGEMASDVMYDILIEAVGEPGSFVCTISTVTTYTETPVDETADWMGDEVVIHMYNSGMPGVNTSDADAIASDIALGKTAYAGGVKLTGTSVSGGIDTSDANAASSDILVDKTAYVNGVKLVGTSLATTKQVTYGIVVGTDFSEAPSAFLATPNNNVIITIVHLDVTYKFVIVQSDASSLTLYGGTASAIYGLNLVITGGVVSIDSIMNLTTGTPTDELANWTGDLGAVITYQTA